MQKRFCKIVFTTIFSAMLVQAGSDTRLPGFFPVIAAGNTHSLLIKPNGQVYAWGSNTSGEIGDGTNTQRLNPVFSQFDFLEVAAGNGFSLGITEWGGLVSWGKNDKGQLGLALTENRNFGTVVGDFGKWRTVAAGYDHAFGIDYSGQLWAWGNNHDGELGIGSFIDQSYPQQVGSGNNWISVAAGKYFTIALQADGSLWGWGLNSNYQLGLGNTSSGHNTPVQIGSTSDHWKSIAVGSGHVLALKDDGSIYAWGLNDQGQVGDNGYPAVRKSYIKVSSGPYKTISAGDHHSLAIKADGSLYAWGDNSKGELSFTSSTTRKLTPSHVGSGKDWQYISAGGYYSIALKADGSLVTWGSNGSGQLGIGNNTANQYAAVKPFQTSGDAFATDSKPGFVTSGQEHELDVRSNGNLETWGDNTSGKLGVSLAVTGGVQLPTVFVTGNQWVAAAGGDDHSVGLKNDGTVWTWGGNEYGQLGNGDLTGASQFNPVHVTTSTDNRWAKIDAGFTTITALKADGTLWKWGGTLGSKPTQYGTTAQRWIAFCNTIAINSDGTLWSISGSTPVQIDANRNWVTVGDGTVGFASAINARGELYDYNSGAMNIFSFGPYLLLAKSDWSTLATGTDGYVFGWGFNNWGEIGDGTTDSYTFPTYSGYWAPRMLSSNGNFLFLELNARGIISGSGNAEVTYIGSRTTPINVPGHIY